MATSKSSAWLRWSILFAVSLFSPPARLQQHKVFYVSSPHFARLCCTPFLLVCEAREQPFDLFGLSSRETESCTSSLSSRCHPHFFVVMFHFCMDSRFQKAAFARCFSLFICIVLTHFVSCPKTRESYLFKRNVASAHKYSCKYCTHIKRVTPIIVKMPHYYY